jgi:hypothetical protein
MNLTSSGNRIGKLLMAKKILVAAGTQTAAGLDTRDFIGTIDAIVASEGDNGDGGATIVFTVLTSSDNATFATYAGAPTPVTVTAASAINTLAIDTRATGIARYVQLKALTASTTATFNTAAIAYGVKQSMP